MTLIFQVHVISAFLLFAWWPFSRLVHAWSIPRRLPAPKPDPLPGSRRPPARRGRPRDPCAGRSMTAERAAPVATSRWRLARSPSASRPGGCWRRSARTSRTSSASPTPSSRSWSRSRWCSGPCSGSRGLVTDRIGGPGRVHGDALYSAGAAVLIGLASSYAALLGTGLLLGAAGATFAVGECRSWPSGSLRSVKGSRSASTDGNIGTAARVLGPVGIPRFCGPGGRRARGRGGHRRLRADLVVARPRRPRPRQPKRQPYGEVLRLGWPLYRPPRCSTSSRSAASSPWRSSCRSC